MSDPWGVQGAFTVWAVFEQVHGECLRCTKGRYKGTSQSVLRIVGGSVHHVGLQSILFGWDVSYLFGDMRQRKKYIRYIQYTYSIQYTAAVISGQKLSGLQQHKLIFLQFQGSDVPRQSTSGLDLGIGKAVISYGSCKGGDLFYF